MLAFNRKRKNKIWKIRDYEGILFDNLKENLKGVY